MHGLDSIVHGSLLRNRKEATQMGLFNDLMTKIFHHAAPAEKPFDAAPPGGAPKIAPNITPQSVPSPNAAGAAAGAAGSVDIAAVLTSMAAANHEKLDWKHSIVDLMKLVGMDSSLTARKELAADLHYTGDTNDSASMNMWLHKEVMRKLAENGGHLPADLQSH
jgi:hypothetical protein